MITGCSVYENGCFSHEFTELSPVEDSNHLAVNGGSDSRGHSPARLSEKQGRKTSVVEVQPSETTGLLPNGVKGNSSSNDLQQVPAAGSGGISSGDIEHVLFGRSLLSTDTMVRFIFMIFCSLFLLKFGSSCFVLNFL